MANLRSQPYKLLPGDADIFATAKMLKDPGIITNYYIRGEETGTYWRHVSDEDYGLLQMPQSREAALRWREGYERLKEQWERLRQPQFFGPDTMNPDKFTVYSESEYRLLREKLRRVYRVVWEDDAYGESRVVFHHPHGSRLLDWQLLMDKNKSDVQIVLGGYGAGKTLGRILLMLTRCVTLKGYRGLGLGPYSIQAKEIFELINQQIDGTEFADRFLLRKASKPNPILEFGHSSIGKTSIECYPILEDPQKLLSVTADEAIIDQIEQFEDIEDVLRIVSSRLRGQVRGRPRIGQITGVANSADHPGLWDLYDEGQKPNRYVWSYSPITFDNSYLTVADFLRFEKRAGRDEQSRGVHLLGKRPIGSGEHFPAAGLLLCKDPSYDDEITKALEANKPGYEAKEADRVDTYYLKTPMKPGGTYITAADPGWANPPERNSACIGTWDITSFPTVPARLVGFHWVFGDNSPLPWISSFKDHVTYYNTFGNCGYDSTGFQSGYDKMTDITDATMPTPVMITAQNKYRYLNVAKKLVNMGLIKIPSRLTHFYAQLAKYKLPDEKLRQDIVSMLLVTAALLEPLMYLVDSVPAADYGTDPEDRYAVPTEGDFYVDRY